jgi:hypothetical protein
MSAKAANAVIDDREHSEGDQAEENRIANKGP